MPIEKSPSLGTLLQLSVDAMFTTVAGMTDVNFPDGEVQFFDANSLDAGVSVPDGELTGQSTPGECGGSAFYDPVDPVHNLLARDHAAGGAYRSWKIIMPDTGASVCTFTGSIKKWVPKAAVRDGFKADLAIKLRSVAVYPAAPEES